MKKVLTKTFKAMERLFCDTIMGQLEEMLIKHVMLWAGS
jgi:hypothetical protein